MFCLAMSLFNNPLYFKGQFSLYRRWLFRFSKVLSGQFGGQAAEAADEALALYRHVDDTAGENLALEVIATFQDDLTLLLLLLFILVPHHHSGAGIAMVGGAIECCPNMHMY